MGVNTITVIIKEVPKKKNKKNNLLTEIETVQRVYSW